MDGCHTMVTLVTGGAGFVGSHLVDHLIKKGERVIVVDNLSSGEIKFIQKWIDSGDVVFQQCDLKDLETLKCVMYDPLGGEPVDIVYHLAANPDIRLGTTITVSKCFFNSCKPSRALLILFGPSCENGKVVTPTVKIFNSLAALAIT